jgi:hypothetical protein
MYTPTESRSQETLTRMLEEDAQKMLGWFELNAHPLAALRRIREKAHRENWTNLGKLNKVTAFLNEILGGGEDFGPLPLPTIGFEERPVPQGLLDDVLQSTVTVTASRDGEANVIRLVVRTTTTKVSQVVTEIVMSDDLAKALKASLPVGFSKDTPPESNPGDVWWKSQRLLIPKDGELVIEIPVQEPLAGEGVIRIGVESRGQTGKTSRLVDVALEPVPG